MSSCDLLCLDLPVAEAIRERLDAERVAATAGVLKTFADPTRLLIAHALLERELCGCDLAWITGQSDEVVSHHLNRLRREGLIESRREGRIVFASLTPHCRALLESLEQVSA